MASLVAQKKKKLHAMQCRRPGFDPLGWEDLLEKGMATHSSVLIYKYTCLFVDTHIYSFSYSFPLKFVCVGIGYSSGY